MSYPQVIALLDEQLDRLRTVRNLLTADPPRKRGRTKSEEDPLEVLARLELAPPDGSAAAAQAPPEPKLIAPRLKRERRSTPRKNRSDISALNGVVPPAPVFVSAENVRSAHTQKHQEKEERAKREPLTAEMLSQKWFRPSAL